MMMNLYVGNLPYSATEEELRTAFAAFGEVSTVNLITDKFSGQSKGFAFVEMEDNASADAAIKGLNETAMGGRWPDLSIIFDVDEQTAAGRLSPLLDRMERKGAVFHRRVREGYHLLAEQRPQDTVVIDATMSEDSVFERLLEVLRGRLGS